MEQDQIQSFINAAEADLASVRSSLLIVAQTGDASDLGAARGILSRLKTQAVSAGMTQMAAACRDCDETIGQLMAGDNTSPGAAYAALDIVARIEATIWDAPLKSDDFLTDVSGFVDDSFDRLLPRAEIINEGPEEFDIDEETLEIFRSEADEILSNIAGNLSLLSIAPDDQNALWEVRRNAHTLKGAAGIVGLRAASEVAHRMEDLLDKIVELRAAADGNVVEFLVASSRRLNAICAARQVDDENDSLDAKYQAALASLALPSPIQATPAASPVPANSQPTVRDAVKPTTTPIVRVSLDRLDELIKLSNTLLVNRAALSERFTEVHLLSENSDTEPFARLEGLIEAQKTLADQIQAKLLRIRMVRFGMLETRLSRNINVTCTDEGKKAILEIENGEVEVDTQVIDALVEPLLHLLKNAVVHGIETPETRRLIGKPERGTIKVRVESDDEDVRISVTDDGSGISAAKLREKAVASGIITAHQADSMNDRDAMRLIFDRGLTTAEKIDLNAGRGVGMSIVRDAVESRGGRIEFDSYPQRGTTFSITMPVQPVRHEAVRTAEPSSRPSTSVRSEPLVLIVDDSPSIRRQAARLAEQAGFRVITANNGAEALELLLNGEWEPDLIMSDVEMPQIDGWSFLEYVKTDQNFGHIPVVMVTSLDAEQHRQRAFGLGASDYLIKPLKPADVERIAASLKRGGVSEPEACLA